MVVSVQVTNMDVTETEGAPEQDGSRSHGGETEKSSAGRLRDEGGGAEESKAGLQP